MIQIKNPLVSIIIPTYNRAWSLPETLDSIIDQSYTNWECIIIDDRSTDNSLEVIKRYIDKDTRFKVYERPDSYRPGANGSRNYGFDLSKGRFIQWFDSDDLMHKELLSEKVNIFNKNPEFQSIISQLYFFENKGEIISQTNFREPFKLFFENTITWNIQVWTQSIMFRKQFLVEINERFDESLNRLHDYDLYSRIFIKYPHKTYLLDKPLCYIRRSSGDSITTSYLNKSKIVELEKTEYIVESKIIKLLIKEKKFSRNLEKSFYRIHKRRITRLVMASNIDVTESIKGLVEKYLNHKEKYFKLARFRVGLILMKAFPVDNFFLIYHRPRYIRFLRTKVKQILKISIGKRQYKTLAKENK